MEDVIKYYCREESLCHLYLLLGARSFNRNSYSMTIAIQDVRINISYVWTTRGSGWHGSRNGRCY